MTPVGWMFVGALALAGYQQWQRKKVTDRRYEQEVLEGREKSERWRKADCARGQHSWHYDQNMQRIPDAVCKHCEEDTGNPSK